MNIEKIAGVYSLVDFEVIKKDGSRSPWRDKKSTGQLIYTPSGFMSVNINAQCELEASLAERYSSVLSYSGTVSFKENTVIHEVNQASDLSRIGKLMMRDARFEGDLLILQGSGDFGKATLKWKKIK